MEYRISMVHNNPGEKPFDTIFNDSEILKQYGYNVQAFKNINAAVMFDKFDSRVFSDESSRKWCMTFRENIDKEIYNAKKSGLSVMYHIDMFVLPIKMYNLYRDQICDDGRISVFRSKTLEIHRAMFDEIFERFPDVDGLIIRVGETYLHDIPYHTGISAVKYGSVKDEKKSLIELISFLRKEICVKHNKKLIFRTWDCFDDKFHASREYYLDITEKIEPHKNLIFSIKHTALDFWRRVKFNECLASGNHRQIVEVQCQREYEGKGAYPSYIMDGVINTFEEYSDPKGLRDIVSDYRLCGVYVWPRGGGWDGPYITNEFWCELNTYVIGKYALNPERSEQDIFFEYIMRRGFDMKNAAKLREMCILSQTAVLKGRYIEKYDDRFNGGIMPCVNWLRDDKIGGLKQLGGIFKTLKSEGTIDDSLEEKRQAASLWHSIRLIADTVEGDDELCRFIRSSAEYGERLFLMIYSAWHVMISYVCESDNIEKCISEYEQNRDLYYKLKEEQSYSSLYVTRYWNEPGIGDTIEMIKQTVSNRLSKLRKGETHEA